MARFRALQDRIGDLYAAQVGWVRRRFRRDAVIGPEDLAQDTFLRLVASPSAEEVRHPKALLVTVATNVARDARRRQARQGGVHVSLDVAYAENEPWSAPDQDAALLLKQIILSMPPLYRDVFLLSRFEDLTYGEIAQRLDLSVKTVEWRMSKALAWCAARLRD